MLSFLKKIFFFCFFIPTVLVAQHIDDDGSVVDDLNAGKNIETFDLRNRNTKGKSFFNENWLFGHFVYDDGSLSKSDYLLKYDLLNQQLLVKLDKGIFIVPSEKISGFILKNNFDASTISEYTFVFEQLKGSTQRVILEKAVEGEYSLFILHDVKLLEPNYVPALDAGRLGAKIVEKNKFYLWANGEFLEIPARNNGAKKFFEKYPSARKYMKERRMKAKSKDYLIALVNFMNQ